MGVGSINYEDFYNISPLVWLVKIHKAHTLSGEWLDYDNVFTYIVQGEAEFIIDETKYILKEGDIAIIPPFKTHIVSNKAEIPLIQYIFHFDIFYDKERSFLKKMGAGNSVNNVSTPEREMLMGRLPTVVRPSKITGLTIKNRFLLMYKEFLDKEEGYEMILKSTATEIIALFIRSISDNSLVECRMPRCWETIEKAIHYINESFHDCELDNNKISEAASVSPNYLSQIFKRQLGIPMHHYISHVRIEKAK